MAAQILYFLFCKVFEDSKHHKNGSYCNQKTFSFLNLKHFWTFLISHLKYVLFTSAIWIVLHSSFLMKSSGLFTDIFGSQRFQKFVFETCRDMSRRNSHKFSQVEILVKKITRKKEQINPMLGP